MKLRVTDIAGIIVLAIMLVLVRFFERDLFYDPLLIFFKKEKEVLPQYDLTKLLLGLAFRYWLNTTISLGIIWLAFKDKSMLKLSTVLYLAFFAILMILIVIILQSASPDVRLLFYVRRFLIQPLFLILFLPAFYYQKRMK